MKNTATLEKFLIIGSIIVFLFSSISVLASTKAYAHSSHDHSKLPLEWHFSDGTQAKLLAKMDSGRWNGSLGLSKLDQKILHSYGIYIGNIFSTTLDKKSLTFKRTSSGVKLMGVENFVNMSYIQEIPIRRSNAISKISTNPSHSAHDHKILNKEWTFSSKTETKIARRIQSGSYPVSVGLTSNERKAMESYGIKNGNIFTAKIAGQNFVITRSSSGVTIDEAFKLEAAFLNKLGAM